MGMVDVSKLLATAEASSSYWRADWYALSSRPHVCHSFFLAFNVRPSTRPDVTGVGAAQLCN